MPDDDLEERTTDLMHALAASDADVSNISAERTEDGMIVTIDLLDPDDRDRVESIATEHGFEATDDTGEQFEAVE
jgi:hypothetical protein